MPAYRLPRLCLDNNSDPNETNNWASQFKRKKICQFAEREWLRLNQGPTTVQNNISNILNKFENK